MKLSTVTTSMPGLRVVERLMQFRTAYGGQIHAE